MNSDLCETESEAEIEVEFETPSSLKAEEKTSPPSTEPGPLFNASEVEWFESEDAEAGLNILRILTGGFVFTVLAGGLASYWVFADRVSINSIVALPSIVVIAIVVGLGWGRAMMGHKESDH